MQTPIFIPHPVYIPSYDAAPSGPMPLEFKICLIIAMLGVVLMLTDLVRSVVTDDIMNFPSRLFDVSIVLLLGGMAGVILCGMYHVVFG